MGDFLIAMGAGIGTAGGFARATGRRVIAFIGDSTFFHSGLSPLASAVHNNHDFMVVILDNGTTGMTGHQPHPGVDLAHLGMERTAVPIEEAVRGLGVKNVLTVNPFKYRKTVDALRELSQHKGVTVLVSRAPCPLHERILPGYRKMRPFRVDQAKCRGHKECVGKAACPAFLLEGGQVTIDEDRCTGCALCAQLCPENAILPVAKETQETKEIGR
jgi:indolepyruvate ferredoxin oxidoreductase, alpha subunit